MKKQRYRENMVWKKVRITPAQDTRLKEIRRGDVSAAIREAIDALFFLKDKGARIRKCDKCRQLFIRKNEEDFSWRKSTAHLRTYVCDDCIS